MVSVTVAGASAVIIMLGTLAVAGLFFLIVLALWPRWYYFTSDVGLIRVRISWLAHGSMVEELAKAGFRLSDRGSWLAWAKRMGDGQRRMPSRLRLPL